jgi:putative membrane protein
MLVKKHLSLKDIFKFAGQHLLWLFPWMLSVTTLYYFTHWKFITIPWLPISLVGTAVAFYVGFKNNQSYDRLWEARKIWGAMVNNSRKLGTMVKNMKAENAKATENTDKIRKKIIYNHIVYLYQFREQLLRPMKWEHVSLYGMFGFYNQKRRDKLFNNFEKELREIHCSRYITNEEMEDLKIYNNISAQLLDRQTQLIQNLFDETSINCMQQIELQSVINNFYDDQGRAERIKNFPFPRKFASFSFVFVCIFVFLLPSGIIGEFAKLGDDMVWMSVPVGVIVGFIYVVMELIGDYSENPFEGLQNDIPMLSICRTIEIDLLQMMGEKDIPEPIQPKNNILL